MAERAIIAYAVAERTQRRTVVQRDRRALTDVLFKIALSARWTKNRVEGDRRQASLAPCLGPHLSARWT
jgi:hypothetical protein